MIPTKRSSTHRTYPDDVTASGMVSPLEIVGLISINEFKKKLDYHMTTFFVDIYLVLCSLFNMYDYKFLS